MEYKNLLNVEDIDKFVKSISRERPEHVAVWLRSTFSRWLRKGCGTTLQCVCSKKFNDPITRMLVELAASAVDKDGPALLAKYLHPVKVRDLPEWAQSSLEDHELWYWSPTEEDREQYNHWVDYLMTLPERDIRMTVDQLVTAVTVWDKQLAKQKMIASLNEGVEVQKIAALEATDYFVVKLLTKAAYQSEGSAMSHCVGGYFGRAGVAIYSLRNAEKTRPCATIEVRTDKKGAGKVHQIKAFANKKIDPVDEVALNAWLQEVGFTRFSSNTWDDDDEYEEDEACEDDEMEEEDDEEEVRPVKRSAPKAKKSIDEDEDNPFEEADDEF